MTPDPCSMPSSQIIAMLNRIDPLVSKLKLLAELSPLVDDSSLPAADRGRVAIGLLELVDDYALQLESLLAIFAGLVPRCREDQP